MIATFTGGGFSQRAVYLQIDLVNYALAIIG